MDTNINNYSGAGVLTFTRYNPFTNSFIRECDEMFVILFLGNHGYYEETGGSLNNKETLEQCAQRETFEESKMSIMYPTEFLIKYVESDDGNGTLYRCYYIINNNTSIIQNYIQNTQLINTMPFPKDFKETTNIGYFKPSEILNPSNKNIFSPRLIRQLRLIIEETYRNKSSL